jgi:hypothetical protein
MMILFVSLSLFCLLLHLLSCSQLPHLYILIRCVVVVFIFYSGAESKVTWACASRDLPEKKRAQ